MKKSSKENNLKKKFKDLFIEEFEDSNESFMDFMLDLINDNTLKKVLAKGQSYYYSRFKKYK